MILVTGATGTVGREVVKLLSESGEKFRALVRASSKDKLPRGVDAAVGDLDQPETLAPALRGVGRLFSLSTGIGVGEKRELALLDAAKKAGVRHIVKISVLGAGTGRADALAAWHERVEKAIADSGIGWTYVRPGSFMSNALQWAATVKSMGKIFSNYGDGKIPPVHPRDIAAVSVKALTSKGHEGKAYPLTGPEALSMSEQVRILSEAAGRPIEYVPISDEVARQNMTRAGLPAPLIDALLPFGEKVRSGAAAEVLPTVEQVTGRPALTFADWARENAAAFR